MMSTAEPADAELAQPLIPPELLKYSVTHSGSLLQRYVVQPDSLLKWLSKPGHLFGEGYQRIYLGSCPSSPTNNLNVIGEGRSFLIGVDALWAEDAAEKRRKNEEHEQATHVVQRERKDASTSHLRSGAGSVRKQTNIDDRRQHSSRHAHTNCEHDEDTLSDGNASSSSGCNSSESEHEHRAYKPWRKRSPAMANGTNKGKQREAMETRANTATSSLKRSQPSASIIGTSPDTLFQKLRGKQHRKHLSSGHSSSQDTVTRVWENIEAGMAPPVQQFLQIPQTCSPLSLAAPSSAASFHTANPYFLSSSSRQNTDNSAMRTAYEHVAERLTPLATGLSALTAPLSRASSRSTVRAQAHDKHRDNLELSLTTEGHSTSEKAGVPKSRGGVHVATPILNDPRRSLLHSPSECSTARHAEPSTINTAKASFNPATKDTRSSALPPAPNTPAPKIHRLHSIDSEKLLGRFTAAKEAGFPPGVEKLERMLVRVGWTKRTDIPADFDEVVAKRFEIRYRPWEELAVVRKKYRLELWGTHSDIVRRLFSTSLQLKYLVPLKPGKTGLSTFSDADQIFSIRCPPLSVGIYKTGKPGLRNMRHIHHPGTLVLLFRARSASIAEDWFLSLHLALSQERIQSLEIHLSALNIRFIVPVATAIATMSVEETEGTAKEVSAAQQAAKILANAGQAGMLLKAKGDLLEQCIAIVKSRDDWAELLHTTETMNTKLAMLWRRGHMIEWLNYNTSVDGTKRVWDLYVGAVMGQTQTTRRLEVYREVHYPTYVRTTGSDYLFEPPSVEGFVQRLRYRNESQKQRLYMFTQNGFIILSKPGRVKIPSFPDKDRWIRNAYEPRSSINAFLHHEVRRTTHNLRHCKGALNAGEVKSVELSRTCSQCGKEGQGVRKHDHQIVVINHNDGKTIRFEVHPASTATEWVARLNAQVEYWKKRRERDASDYLTLSQNGRDTVSTRYQKHRKTMPAFQAREMEEAETNGDAFNPLLAEAFNFCSILGCRLGVLRYGRLFFKRGHKTQPFENTFVLLTHTHLMRFEAVTRNIQGRPVPLVYHRRLETIHLRDLYLFTADGCSQYLDSHIKGRFDPAGDQSQTARIYRDGLISHDDPQDCTFALWKQKFTPKGKAGLGKNGQVYIFQARSRLERDLWVHSFNATCERLVRTNREREVRLSTFKGIK